MYPALVTAEAIHKRCPEVKFVFAGSVGGMERPLVEKSSVPFAAYHEVQAGPLHGVGPLRALASMLRIMAGTLRALLLLLRQRPAAILTTGGWVCFPVTLAGWLVRVPILIFLPDIEPGLAIRVIRHLAAQVAVTTPNSQPFFREGQMVVTGYPLRDSLLAATRAAGIARFGLDPARKTLLVMGGSLGARSLNNALVAHLDDLLQAGVQVIHISGEADADRLKLLAQQPHYHLYTYLHDIGLAMAAADLVVCRAGASILGELPHFGLPAVLVPYPYAWRYQKVNADYLAQHDAALVMEDANLERDLLPTLLRLLQDPVRLAYMRSQAAALAQPDAAARIGEALLKLAGSRCV